MASVAKWLRQRVVVPPLVGSSPIVRPFSVVVLCCDIDLFAITLKGVGADLIKR
jgi:hypothetical protein